MGALHAGHQSLIKIARELAEEVVVSVFVNPLQFEDKSDLAKYPKTPEQDAQLAQEAGATLSWRPAVGKINTDNERKIRAGDLGARFEGVNRAGHFDGVLTVVNRLFSLVRPKFAIFGEKDLQQLFLIKQMAARLHPDIEIIAAPTIREESGLALSSRNIRLSNSGRDTATKIFQSLKTAANQDSLTQMRIELERLNHQSGFLLDYAEIIDAQTNEIATDQTEDCRAIVAGWVEGVRLIDNMAMQSALVRL